MAAEAFLRNQAVKSVHGFERPAHAAWYAEITAVSQLSGDSMPTKLKAYQTSLGFYDLAIAAPSMKAALEAWGADSNLFHQGVAKESENPDVIAATMAAPGVVLKRPVGSSASFKEHAELPTGLLGDRRKGRGETSRKSGKLPPPKINEEAARKTAADFEREQAKRPSQAPAGGSRLSEGA